MPRGSAGDSLRFAVDLVRRASRVPSRPLGRLSLRERRSGIVSAMAKIDKPVRRPGDDAHIEPGRMDARLERRGSFFLAVPRGRTPAPLTQAETAAVIDEIRTRDDRDDSREQRS